MPRGASPLSPPRVIALRRASSKLVAVSRRVRIAYPASTIAVAFRVRDAYPTRSASTHQFTSHPRCVTRALDLSGSTDLRRTFCADEIARLAELKLLRRAPVAPADADLCGRDIHREQLRAQVRGWLADMLLEPLGAQVNAHFAALRTARPGESPILYLRLEFRPDRDLPLLRLPWELLHQHPLTNGDVHVGRYLRYDAAPGRLDPAPGLLHLLVLESDPADDALPRLRLHERERIVDGLKGTKSAGRFAVSPVVPAGYRATRETLQALGDQPVILHFAGHGDFGWRCEQCRRLATTRDGNPCGQSSCGFQRHGAPTGFLAFTDPAGRADWIGSDGLRNLLKRADVRLVVLNACKSATGLGAADVFNGLAQRLMDIVPAVVATPFPLETMAAEEFAGLLYQGLGEGLPLVEALHPV